MKNQKQDLMQLLVLLLLVLLLQQAVPSDPQQAQIYLMKLQIVIQVLQLFKNS